MTAVVAALWHPSPDGHDAASWLVGAAFVLALGLATLAVAVTVRARRRLVGVDDLEADRQRELARVWVVVAAVLIVLTVDKAFDLQTGLLDLTRRFAYRNGWYAERREYQYEFIVALLAAGAVLGIVLAFVLRRVLTRIGLVVASVLALVAFVVVRAISFHYVDHFLEIGGRYGMDLFLQLATVGLVVFATLSWHLTERRIVAAALARGATGSGRQLPAPQQLPAPTLVDQSVL